VNTVTGYGWAIEPIWVGEQDPCWGGNQAKFSTNTSTAFSEGETEAGEARSALSSEGFNPGTSGNTSIVYDLENYTQTTACIAAAQHFVEGWDTILASAPSQVAGVYGSTCASDLAALTGSPTPHFIWGAQWDGDPNTNDMGCNLAGKWTNSQRLKQYVSEHNETWPEAGGVELYIDTDNANGPVYY